MSYDDEVQLAAAGAVREVDYWCLEGKDRRAEAVKWAKRYNVVLSDVLREMGWIEAEPYMFENQA